MPAALLAVLALSIARVVVVRDGPRTVLAVQSERPWPLPEGVSMADAKPVPAALFDAVDGDDTPRVDEQWEADPCPLPEPREDRQNMQGRMNGNEATGFVARYDHPATARGIAAVETTAPGFRVEYTEAVLRVPVIAGQEVLIHVLAPTRFDAASGPTRFLPEAAELPLAAAGHVPEFFGALFEDATARTPGVVLTESAGPFSDDDRAVSRVNVRHLLDADGSGPLTATRLHVRPLAKTLELQPAAPRAFRRHAIHHPWDAPVRCVDPQDGNWQPTTTIPLAPAVTRAPEGPLLAAADIPELGLRRGTWARLAPFDRGSIVGAVLGVAVAFVARRRRPSDQGPT